MEETVKSQRKIFWDFFSAKTAHHTQRHGEPWQNAHHFTSHQCAVRSASFISLLVFNMNSASLRRWRPWDQVNANILRKPAAATYLQPWQESVIKPRHKTICAIWHFFRAIVPVNLIQPLKPIGGIEWGWGVYAVFDLKAWKPWRGISKRLSTLNKRGLDDKQLSIYSSLGHKKGNKRLTQGGTAQHSAGSELAKGSWSTTLSTHWVLR